MKEKSNFDNIFSNYLIANLEIDLKYIILEKTIFENLIDDRFDLYKEKKILFFFWFFWFNNFSNKNEYFKFKYFKDYVKNPNYLNEITFIRTPIYVQTNDYLFFYSNKKQMILLIFSKRNSGTTINLLMYQFTYKMEMFNECYINYFVLFNSNKSFE